MIERGADATGALVQNLPAWSAHDRITMAASLHINTEPTTHHVQSVTRSSANTGCGSKHGLAIVTVVGEFGSPLNSASVTGTLSGCFGNAVSGNTDGSGSVTLITTATAKGGVTFTFCVDDMTHSGGTVYDPGRPIPPRVRAFNGQPGGKGSREATIPSRIFECLARGESFKWPYLASTYP